MKFKVTFQTGQTGGHRCDRCYTRLSPQTGALWLFDAFVLDADVLPISSGSIVYRTENGEAYSQWMTWGHHSLFPHFKPEYKIACDIKETAEKEFGERWRLAVKEENIASARGIIIAAFPEYESIIRSGKLLPGGARVVREASLWSLPHDERDIWLDMRVPQRLVELVHEAHKMVGQTE